MANSIKIQRLKKIVESLRGVDPRAAFDLISVIDTIERPVRPLKQIEESVQISLKELSQKMIGIDWCLAGALAVLQWAEIRKTSDIDCLIMSSDMNEIKNRFKTEEGLIGLTSEIKGVEIDFLDSKFFPWSLDAINSAKTMDIIGTKIPVMLPEYLIAFKLKSARDRDISDILHLLLIDGVPEKSKKIITKHEIDLLPDLEQLIAMSEIGAI